MLSTPELNRLVADGFLTPEQRDRIAEHYKLRKHRNPMLAIVGGLGGVLVGLGLLLLVASNWDEIPRAVKLLSGLGIMWGLHFAGWKLSHGDKTSPKAAGAFHLGGSLMWMGNIALVGQMYNLSSRPPNALLLYCVGIAAIPFVLRSLPQFLLLLTAFSVWVGFEICEPDSWIGLAEPGMRFLFYAILGLVLFGLGGVLRRRGSFGTFGPPTEVLGVAMFQFAAYPLTIREFHRHLAHGTNAFPLFLLGAAVVAVIVNVLARDKDKSEIGLWRVLGVGGALALVCGCVAWSIYQPDPGTQWWEAQGSPVHYAASLALFCLTLLQIQGGVHMRSTSMVNLGIAALALQVVTVYIQLMGTMLQTGLVFVVSGLLLIFLTVVLERRRRSLLARMRDADESGDTTRGNPEISGGTSQASQPHPL